MTGQWSNTVTKISLRSREKLTKVPDQWPTTLTSIDLSYCKSIATLPDEWPTSLTTIILLECKSITNLPDRWPTSLTTINLNGCMSITKLPDRWPTSLTSTTIDLSMCTSLTALPHRWLDTVTEINLSGCESLTSLPGIPPVALDDINMQGCLALRPIMHRLNILNNKDDGRFEIESLADWHRLTTVLLTENLQRSTTDLPAIERFIESFLVDDYVYSEDSTAHNETVIVVDEEEGGDGETGGRLVTCSNFNNFVSGSFVAPLWPPEKDTEEVEETKAATLDAPEGSERRQSLELAYKQKKGWPQKNVSLEDEKVILDKNQIIYSESRQKYGMKKSSSGNARLYKLIRITHLVNPAHDFLGQLLDLPPWVQARLFKSEVSFNSSLF